MPDPIGIALLLEETKLVLSLNGTCLDLVGGLKPSSLLELGPHLASRSQIFILVGRVILLFLSHGTGVLLLRRGVVSMDGDLWSFATKLHHVGGAQHLLGLDLLLLDLLLPLPGLLDQEVLQLGLLSPHEGLQSPLLPLLVHLLELWRLGIKDLLVHTDLVIE